MDIVIFIIAFLGIVFVSTCIHECGHALGAKWCNYRNISITIGAGKKRFSFRLLDIEWNICNLFFMGGHTSYEIPHSKTFQPLDIMLISMMGPVVNGFIVYILLITTDVYVHNILTLLFLFNAWLICGNTVPFKWKDIKSDGYITVQMIYKQIFIQSKD